MLLESRGDYLNNLKLTLKACRVNANLTIKEVADYIDKTERTIQNWEKGITIPDVSNLKLLSQLYSVDEGIIFLGSKSVLNGFYREFRKNLNS